MATTSNGENTNGSKDSNFGMGFLAGLVILVAIVLILILLVPSLRKTSGDQSNETPQPTSEINRPENTNINIVPNSIPSTPEQTPKSE